MGQSGHDYDTASTVNRLIECWPNDLKEVAHSIGTTALQLQGFLAGRDNLPGVPCQRLIETVSLESDEYDGKLPRGPHVFLAK